MDQEGIGEAERECCLHELQKVSFNCDDAIKRVSMAACFRTGTHAIKVASGCRPALWAHQKAPTDEVYETFRHVKPYPPKSCQEASAVRIGLVLNEDVSGRGVRHDSTPANENCAG